MDHTSIHWRRRWFYALWAALLGAALGAYALWAIPGRKGTASLAVSMGLKGVEGLTVSLGSFPEGGLPNEWKAMTLREGRLVGELQVPLAYRRWTGVPHSARCHQGILIRGEKGGKARYFLIDLREDLATGLLAPRRRIILQYGGLDWERMHEDIPRLSRLP